MKKKDVFWGLLFILAGVLIIVNGLGYFNEKISVFEIVATIILVGIMIKSILYVSFPGILFPIAFLCIIYTKQWGITELTPWPVLLTALLGSIGLSMIFSKKKYWNHQGWNHPGCNSHNDCKEEHFGEVIDQPDDNVVDCFVNFGSSMKYINTDNFERANIKCSFGSMKVYFDNAVVSSGSAEINLDVSFAGVELYIPKTWKIVNAVNVSLGAMEEKNRKVESDSPVVTIRGNVSFSGVEIMYV